MGMAQDVTHQRLKDPSASLNFLHVGCSGVTGAISSLVGKAVGGPKDLLKDVNDTGGLNSKGVVWDTVNTILGGQVCDRLFGS